MDLLCLNQMRRRHSGMCRSSDRSGSDSEDVKCGKKTGRGMIVGTEIELAASVSTVAAKSAGWDGNARSGLSLAGDVATICLASSVRSSVRHGPIFSIFAQLPFKELQQALSLLLIGPPITQARTGVMEVRSRKATTMPARRTSAHFQYSVRAPSIPVFVLAVNYLILKE